MSKLNKLKTFVSDHRHVVTVCVVILVIILFAIFS